VGHGQRRGRPATGTGHVHPVGDAVEPPGWWLVSRAGRRPGAAGHHFRHCWTPIGHGADVRPTRVPTPVQDRAPARRWPASGPHRTCRPCSFARERRRAREGVAQSESASPIRAPANIKIKKSSPTSRHRARREPSLGCQAAAAPFLVGFAARRGGGPTPGRTATVRMMNYERDPLARNAHLRRTPRAEQRYRHTACPPTTPSRSM
jgi:hypothetical protein